MTTASCPRFPSARSVSHGDFNVPDLGREIELLMAQYVFDHGVSLPLVAISVSLIVLRMIELACNPTQFGPKR